MAELRRKRMRGLQLGVSRAGARHFRPTAKVERLARGATRGVRQRDCRNAATALASSAPSVWATADITGAFARAPFLKTSIWRNR